MKIFQSTLLQKQVQFRFPRSKKKRIKRKWQKDKRNFRIESNQAIIAGDKIFVSPEVYQAIRDKYPEMVIDPNHIAAFM